LTLRAADGAVAVLEPPFGVLTGFESVADLAAHVAAPRRVGILLVRLGGYAAGVFEGRELVSSKVGSRPVHGRAAAGGWSQQRFARRREGQARVALEAAADAAVAVLLPVASTLDAVVTGGDRQALRAVLGDVRLAALESLVSARVLDVPDPKAKVLRESIEAALAVRVRITDPV
jgi:peptide subunit release factor 1 (eRF1)